MSTHQIFISSYAKDFPWLRVCLYSLRMHCKGFLPPVICIDQEDLRGAKELVNQVYPETRIAILNNRPPGTARSGFMRAQIGMMSCDLLSPDKADFYYLVGSDCMAFRTMTPEQHFYKGKPALLWNTYAEISNGKDGGVSAWRTGTETVLGWDCPNEYMRRLPIIYPKELFAPMRRYVTYRHRQPTFEAAIYFLHSNGVAISESNIMGGYAARNMSHLYSWLHAANNPEYIEFRTPESDSLIQWWSHGGMDRPAETCVNYAPGKNTAGQTPRAVIRELFGNSFV